MKILLTGASGFIGSNLLESLCERSLDVAPVYRQQYDNEIHIPDINEKTDWSSALDDIDVVIHAAALVHEVSDALDDLYSQYYEVNVAGTLNLAQQAAEANVRRFIFISSIKVNGEETQKEKPFSENVLSIPTDLYGLSKYKAEQGLINFGEKTGIEIVIVRPVLVYGPGVKANFLSMMRWVDSGFPLPLGAIKNKRSLVALDNLIDFIITCIDHPKAANEIFLVSDDDDLSVLDLLKRLAYFLGVRSRLFPVPESVLQFGARLLGKKAFAQKLCGSLQVDITKAKDVLGWTPPVSVDEALKKTVLAFLQAQKNSA